MMTGIPQGSVLESSLFLVHVKDIAHERSCITRTFTDDTSLAAASLNDLNVVKAKLTKTLQTVK